MSFKVNTRTVLSEAISRGIVSGMTSAFKHTDSPTREETETAIEEHVIAAIDEWFDVTDPCAEF